jgi:hypothetical protein
MRFHSSFDRLRIAEEPSAAHRLLSFQFLSCVSPFIWIKLVTIFDGWKTVGSLQIVVFRMLRESLIFFIVIPSSSPFPNLATELIFLRFRLNACVFYSSWA